MNRPTASITPDSRAPPPSAQRPIADSLAPGEAPCPMGTHVRMAVATCLLLLSPAAVAQGTDYGTQSPQVAPEPPPQPSLVRRYSVGPRFLIAPGVFIPSSGSAGFTLG